MQNAIIAGARIFDGDDFHDQHALVCENGRIKAIVPNSDLAGCDDVAWVEGGLIVPGFIDVQVNGGGGELLNNNPSAETLARIASAHTLTGTTALLPTLITDTPEITHQAINATIEVASAKPEILGLHLEGPHLAPARHGAHLAALMRPISEDDLQRLCRAKERLPILHITLAAEQASPSQVARLVEAGVIVSLGHSDATSDEAQALFAAGARGVTHLFNAMSGLGHRSPGMVGAALDTGAIWCGIIADGHHVDPVALRIALRAKRGPGRLFYVTDAMALAGSRDTDFELNERVVRREPGAVCSRLVLEDGTLAGSDLDMASAVRFGVEALEISLPESLRMASTYPATYLGIEDERGYLKPGYRADFVNLTHDLNVKQVWLGGAIQPAQG